MEITHKRTVPRATLHSPSGNDVGRTQAEREKYCGAVFRSGTKFRMKFVMKWRPMAALRREDGPKKGNAKKGQKSRLMEWNIEDCSFLSVALGKKWMGPVTDIEIYSAAVATLCSRYHEKGDKWWNWSLFIINNNWDSICYSICIATRQWAGRRGTPNSIPGRAKTFYVLHNSQTGPGIHRASYPMGTGRLYSGWGERRLTCQADSSSPWSHTSTSLHAFMALC